MQVTRVSSGCNSRGLQSTRVPQEMSRNGIVLARVSMLLTRITFNFTSGGLSVATVVAGVMVK